MYDRIPDAEMSTLTETRVVEVFTVEAEGD